MSGYDIYDYNEGCFKRDSHNFQRILKKTFEKKGLKEL
jgi:hypothetical protein